MPSILADTRRARQARPGPPRHTEVERWPTLRRIARDTNAILVQSRRRKHPRRRRGRSMRYIALEEAFFIPEMDGAGIDIQVLSLTVPGMQVGIGA
ncbi:hypothetical protein MHEI_18750 [Mycobacterium heidelbergense]|nr:hypothetical protein MHEI_18750 [Mycobacterium heidelbergense]